MNRRSGLTQNPMDEPVPLDTSNPLKRGRYNYKFKMTLPCSIVPPVPLMQMALVDDLHAGRLKTRLELLRNDLAFIHGIVPLPVMDVSLYN